MNEPAPLPRLYRVIMPVTDIEHATRFYGALLGIPGERVSPGRHYFDCGGTILACFDPRADGDDMDATPLPDHIYIAVVNLEAWLTRARSLECKRVDEQARTQPWGERCFYLTDPFGNRVCFVDDTTLFTGRQA